MNVFETLEKVKDYAKAHPDFRQQLLESSKQRNAVSTFCAICREHGFEIAAMDLVDAGEEAYAAMRRSTNGGGENSPLLQGEDDLYELFLTALGE